MVVDKPIEHNHPARLANDVAATVVGYDYAHLLLRDTAVMFHFAFILDLASRLRVEYLSRVRMYCSIIAEESFIIPILSR